MINEILKRRPKRSAEVQPWLDREVKEQRVQYERIAFGMNIELAKQRERWIREFYQRIQTTGFYWHADNEKIIEPEEIFPKPDREFKVVF